MGKTQQLGWFYHIDRENKMIIYPYMENKNGISVKELKDYLSFIPDIDPETGEKNKVWLQSGAGLSSPAIQIHRCDRSDIILTYDITL